MKIVPTAENPGRRSIRLRGFDYRGNGAFYITLCVEGRTPLFGSVEGCEFRESECGAIAREEWLRSADIRREVTLDEFVFMPDHMHAVVWLAAEKADGPSASFLIPKSLGALVAAYKSAVTRKIHKLLGDESLLVWQRNYYEHIVRDDSDLLRIRGYIRDNPLRWASRHGSHGT